MKLRNFVVVSTLAVFALPALAGDQESPPTPLAMNPAASSQSVEAPPISAELLGAIFADNSGRTCPPALLRFQRLRRLRTSAGSLLHRLLVL